MANKSLSIDKSISWRPLSTAPSDPVLSEIYLDATTHTLLEWNGTAWVPIGGASAPDVKFAITQNVSPWSITADAPMKLDTLRYDTAGAYDPSTGLFTAPISGLYLLTASIQFNTSSSVFWYVNGSNIGIAGLKNYLGEVVAAVGDTVAFTTEVPLNVGDTLFIGSDTTQTVSGAGASHYEICLLSTEVVVSGNPTVAQVSFSTSTSVAANGTLVYDNVISDTDGAYDPTTGLYTVKKSGFYHCSAFNPPSGAQTNLVLCRNGVQTFLLSSGSSTFIAGASVTMSCVVGDTISVQTEAATTFNGDILPLHQTYLCIELVPGTTTAATEPNKIAAMVALTSNYAAGNDLPVIFDTVVKDSNPGAYSTTTGLYTCPFDGDYQISITYQTATAFTSAHTPYVTKTGSRYLQCPIASVFTNAGGGIISCVAGDTLAFYNDVSDTYIGNIGPYACYMSINKL